MNYIPEQLDLLIAAIVGQAYYDAAHKAPKTTGREYKTTGEQQACAETWIELDGRDWAAVIAPLVEMPAYTSVGRIPDRLVES